MTDQLTVLRAETAQVTDLLRSADVAAPVAACPGWTVRDLAVHLGNIHLWAAAALRAGGEKVLPTPQQPGADLAGWYAGTAADLLAALDERDPDAPAWGFGPPPRTAAFWRRRQVHESALHRWDLEVAAGAPSGFDPELAADGVDEVVTVMLPRQLHLQRTPPLPAPVALSTGERTWTLGGDDPVATVTGPAEALLLLLWHRTGPDDRRLTITGDRSAAEQVLALPLAP